MNKITVLLLSVLALLTACRGNEDDRFFAPDVGFGEEQYAVAAETGGVDVLLPFSRPAPAAFQIGLVFSGSLREGVQYRVASHQLSVAEGDTQARLHIDLVPDEIWDEESWIGISLAPGSRYTVDPEGKCAAKILVSKEIILPILHFSSPDGTVQTNPFLAETLSFEITADKAPARDLTLQLDLDGMTSGTDCLVDGTETTQVTFPAGADKTSFEVRILKKDESGCDRHATLSLLPQKGAYIVSSEAGSMDIHLYDPVVDFSPLWRTAALNNGTGYQLRQAIKTPEGEWSGNLAADLYVSSDGSNYLRNFRNMFDSSWSCRANSPGGNVLRLTEFFPKYGSPNPTRILDYGAAANTRTFSPVDSLMRFVLDPGETRKGSICLTEPRTFIALTGSYDEWQADVIGGKAWQVDSRETGGDIFASKHAALTGRITVKLVKLEGRFDLDDATQPLLFSAWFTCDDPFFMEDVDRTKFNLTEEDGMWKVEYKLWPR